MARDDEEIWQPTLQGDPLNWLIEQVWNKPTRWRNRWHWRHNPAPAPSDQSLLDKQGRAYWMRVIEADPLTMFKVFYCGECIGYVNLLWDQDMKCLVLSDISLGKDHRGRGLGMLLMTRIEGVAWKWGAREILGRVVADDLEAFPGLLDWYRKQGFTIKPPSVDNPQNTIAQVAKLIEREA